MKAYVYRSDRKLGTYLYLREQDAFGLVPAEIIKSLQPLVLTLTFDLTPDRNLAQADPKAVAANLAAIGYHIQFPPRDDLAPPVA